MLQYSRSPAVGQATSRNNRGYSENLKLQIQFPSHLQRSTAHCIFFPFLLFLTFLPCLTLGEFEAFLTTCEIDESLCFVSLRSIVEAVEAVNGSPSSRSPASLSSSPSAFFLFLFFTLLSTPSLCFSNSTFSASYFLTPSKLSRAKAIDNL